MPNTSWKYFVVYETTNLVNGRKYIGCHKTNYLDDGYLGSGTLLKRAVKKHGEDKFTRNDLFIFDNEDDMFAKEKELITDNVLDSENYYNVNTGGNGGFSHIHRDMDKYRPMFNRKPDGWEHWSKRDPERHSNLMSQSAKKAAKTMRNRLGEEAYKERMRKYANMQTGAPKKSARGAKGCKWTTDGVNKKKIPKYYVLEEGWRYGLPHSLKPVTVGKINKNCSFCGNEMTLYPSQAKTRQCCSRSCSRKLVAQRNKMNG